MERTRTGGVVEAFRRYVAVFERLEPRAVAAFYNKPAMLISPQGVVALPTAEAVEQVFTRVMGDLRDQEYARSEFRRLAEHRLSSNLAMVSGVGVWLKDSGQEIRRFGLTYTFCRQTDAWLIAVAAVHDEDAALPSAP
jgi:hypothetical protein